ncbi:MAG TPA: hypothetical protein VGO58_12455, partial [Chitinophagaceae bacterium]|nr:hypothetical protein [Chitinophagaceae bacterium]
MYKSIMTLILSASIAIASSQPAYKADQVIPLDLLSVAGPFPGNFNIKKNVRIRYKIDNINRNVYTVSVNSESKSFFQEKPPIFGVISDIDLSKLAPVLPVHPAAAAGTPLGVLKARATAVPEAQIIANYEAAKTNVNNAIQAYEANDINFKKITSHYRVLCNMLTDGSTPFLDIFSTKQTNTDALLRADFAYVGSATNDQQLVAHLQTSTENLINTQLLGYSTILARQNILKQNYVFLEALVMAKIQQLKAAMAAAPVGVRPPIQVQIDDLSTELVIEKLIVDGIIEVINDIKLVHAKMAELNQSGFSQALYIAYRRITLANWQYISPSILGENDEVTVTMTVDAKEGTIPSPNYAMFNGKVKGMVYG